MARPSLCSLAFQRARSKTETYTIEDDDEDAESDSGEANRKSSSRLSLMFEHNDLINNRIAGLAKSIRQRTMPRPRRLSLVAHQEDETASDTQEDDENWEASSSSCSPSQPFEDSSDVSQLDALKQRCVHLETRVHQLEVENTALRASLDSQNSETNLAPRSVLHGEGPCANPHKLRSEQDKVNISDTADDALQSDRPMLDEGVETGSESVARYVSIGKEGCSQAALMFGKEQRRQQRAKKKKQRHAIDRVEQCESIVDHLLDTIDVLKTSVAASPEAKETETDEIESEQDNYVADLREAIGDFFSGMTSIGHASELVEEASPQWKRRLHSKHSSTKSVMYF